MSAAPASSASTATSGRAIMLIWSPNSDIASADQKLRNTGLLRSR